MGATKPLSDRKICYTCAYWIGTSEILRDCNYNDRWSSKHYKDRCKHWKHRNGHRVHLDDNGVLVVHSHTT